MNYRKVADVYQTDDYSLFKKLEGNRDAKNITAIKKSMEKVGVLLDPILINEKYEVIDGQHRLEALKQLGMPVNFMIQEGIGLEECRLMNTGQRNWGSMDYVKSYAESGNVNYQRILQLYAEYGKDFGLDGIVAIALEPKEGGSLLWAKQGDLHLPERGYEIACKRLNYLRSTGIVGIVKEKKLSTRIFCNAIGYAFRHPEVSIKELIDKLLKSPLELVTYSKTIDELKLFDEIYNKGRKSKKVFMATDFQLGKYKKDVYK